MPFGTIVASGIMLALSSAGTQAKNHQLLVAPKESAGAAVSRQLRELTSGQFGREWDELHPAQQQSVGRSQWERCAAAVYLPELKGVTVLETYADPIDVPDVPEKTSMAVTVRMDTSAGQETTTFHEVAVGGQWRWVLSDLSPYKDGKCPA